MHKNGIKSDENFIPDYEHLFTENAEQLKKKPSIILTSIFKENWINIILAFFLYIVKNCACWIIPIITANVINVVTKPDENTLKYIIINAVVLVAVLLQNIPTHVLYAKVSNRMLRSIGAGLRNTMIRKLQHLSLTYHKQLESGRIQAKFLRDIEAIEFFNNHLINSIMPAIISIIIAVGISWYKSGTVTIFYAVVIPINVTLITLFSRKIKKNNRQFRMANENMSANMTTMIEMIPVTKAHGLEDNEISKLENSIRSTKQKGMILDRTNAYFNSVLWVISQLLSGSCLVFSGILALKGKINAGDIVIYQTYFTSISASVQTLVNLYPELSKGIEAVRSFSEIVLSDDTEDSQNKIKLRYVHGEVEFDNVSYRYPNTDKDVLKNITLSVEPGECVAFVGASGSGKSTIMNMIIGFLKATEGVVKIDGKPISELNLSTYRHFISVVPQNSILFAGTIRDNITYGLPYVDEEILDKVIESANIKEFLPQLSDGLDTVIGEHGDKLSGGQKQRISIARALIRNPKILILDEATSALDNISEYHVQKAIDSLVKDRTTFIVAHRLSTIRNADKIVVMDEGRIVEMGTYDELINLQGHFYELNKLNQIKEKQYSLEQ